MELYMGSLTTICIITCEDMYEREAVHFPPKRLRGQACSRRSFRLAFGDQRGTGRDLHRQDCAGAEKMIGIASCPAAFERLANEWDIEAWWRMVVQIGDCIIVRRHLARQETQHESRRVEERPQIGLVVFRIEHVAIRKP